MRSASAQGLKLKKSRQGLLAIYGFGSKKNKLGLEDFHEGQKRKKGRPCPPCEDLHMLPVPNFYYTLKDIIFAAPNNKEGLTWSIHCSTHIFGFSPWSLMNVLGTLCVYTTIFKHEELSFKYPGNNISWE